MGTTMAFYIMKNQNFQHDELQQKMKEFSELSYMKMDIMANTLHMLIDAQLLYNAIEIPDGFAAIRVP